MDTPPVPPPLAPTEPPPLAVDPETYCHRCHTVGPTREVTFYQHIGAVLLMFNQHVKGRMCRNCVNAEFAKRTLITSFLGWWGLISFLLTPAFLLNNSVRYLLSTSLKTSPDREESGKGLATTALVVSALALGWFVYVVLSVFRII